MPLFIPTECATEGTLVWSDEHQAIFVVTDVAGDYGNGVSLARGEKW